MTFAEIERTCVQYREPLRLGGVAALCLVFYATAITGALWHVGGSSPIAWLSPEQAQAAVLDPAATICRSDAAVN